MEYSYDLSGADMSSGLFGLVMAAIASMLLVIFIVIAVIYLLNSITIYKMLKALYYPNAWMAFIPYLQQFARADAVVGFMEQPKVLGIKCNETVFKLGFLIGLVLCLIPFLNFILYPTWFVAWNGKVHNLMWDALEGYEEPHNGAIGYLATFINIVFLIKSWVAISRNKNL